MLYFHTNGTESVYRHRGVVSILAGLDGSRRQRRYATHFQRLTQLGRAQRGAASELLPFADGFFFIRHACESGNPPTNHRHSRAGGNPVVSPISRSTITSSFPRRRESTHQPPSFPRRRESTTNHRHSRAGGNPGSCSGSCASALSSFASTASASLRARPSGRTAHRRARAVFGFAQGTAFRPGFPPARE